MNTRTLRGGLACALLATTCLSHPALAQSFPALPIETPVDEYGVDLTTGEVRREEVPLTIGNTDGSSLSHIRSSRGTWWVNHNFEVEVRTTSTTAKVYIDNDVSTFTLSGGVYVSDQRDGSLLTATGSSFTYTASDGTIVYFARSLSSVSGGALGTQITRPSGERLTLTYSTDYEYEMVSDPNTGDTYYLTVEKHRLLSVNSNTGLQLKYEYDDTGYSYYLVAKVTALNNAIDYCDPAAYSCSGLTQAWPSVTYTRPSGGNTFTTVDSLGKATRYTASSPGGIVAIRRPSSSGADHLVYTYDNQNRVISASNGAHNRTYTWSTPGAVAVTLNDSLGRQRVVTSNGSQGGILSDTDANGDTTTYERDIYGRLAKLEMPENNAITFNYDARGNVTHRGILDKTESGPITTMVAQYPASCTATTLATCNKPISIADAKGNVTSYTYNSAGQVISVTSPAVGGVSPVTNYEYSPLFAYYKNGAGSIVAAADPVSKLTATWSCATGSGCSSSSSTAVNTTIGYGPAGAPNNLQPITRSSGAGDGSLTAITTMTYDPFGNLIELDGPLASDVVRVRYDAGRRPVGSVSPDPDGAGPLKHRAVRTTYNDDGQPTAITRGTVNSQSDTDWASFTPIEQQNISYDFQGRKTKETLTTATTGTIPHAVVQYEYDDANRLLCVAQRMNLNGTLPEACTPAQPGAHGPDRIVKRVYDAADQIVKVQDGIGESVRDVVTITYNFNGKPLTITDAEGNKTTYEYDLYDRLSKTIYPSKTIDGQSDANDYEQLTYDRAGNVISKRLRDSTVATFAYDARGRLSGVTPPNGEPTVSYTYDNLGRLTQALDMYGHKAAYSYDALGRKTSEGNYYYTFASEYDLAGRRTRLSGTDGYDVSFTHLVTGEMSRIIDGGGVAVTFGYDPATNAGQAGQRTSISRANGTVTSYGYDSALRLASLKQDLADTANDLTLTFAYNPAGQIVSTTRSNDGYAFAGSVSAAADYTANGLNQYVQAGAVAPAYDARGNTTFAGGASFTYDSHNRLVLVNGQKLFYYEPGGRLVHPADTSIHMGYDGPDLIADYNSNGFGLVRAWVHGSGVDEPLIEYENGQRRFLHADERGSIVAISDGAGNAVAINRYDEYGKPAAGNVGRFQYTGQAWLPEVGLSYYKARMYDPGLGRFLQPDPIGYGDGMNLYSYVGNDPVNFVDPWGECRLPGDRSDTIVICGPGRDNDPFDALDRVPYTGPARLRESSPESAQVAPRQRPQSRRDPQSSRCTSAFVSSFYNAGGILTEAGAGAVAVGAGVVLLGGGNPVSDTIGGLFIVAGAGATAIGTLAQAGAGIYYLTRGNSVPLQNLAIEKVLGFAGTPRLLGPALNKASDKAIGSARGPAHPCSPSPRP